MAAWGKGYQTLIEKQKLQKEQVWPEEVGSTSHTKGAKVWVGTPQEKSFTSSLTHCPHRRSSGAAHGLL